MIVLDKLGTGNFGLTSVLFTTSNTLKGKAAAGIQKVDTLVIPPETC